MATKNVAGARRWDEGDARAALAELAASGLPMATFARSRGYSAQRLRRWRDLIAGGAGQAAPPRFLPVVVRAGSERMDRPAVVVAVKDVRIEIAEPGAVDATWISALVGCVRGT